MHHIEASFLHFPLEKPQLPEIVNNFFYETLIFFTKRSKYDIIGFKASFFFLTGP